MYEETLLLYTLKAAQCMKKQAEVIREGALFLGFMLAKKVELRVGEAIKLLELKKDIYHVDAFELYQQKGKLEDRVQRLRDVYAQNCQSYVSILKKSMLEEKTKRGKWEEFDKVGEFEVIDLPELQQLMRGCWREIVSDMRFVYFGDETMRLIYQDLARFYLCMNSEKTMPFSNKGKEFDWLEFSNAFEKLDWQAFCDKKAE